MVINILMSTLRFNGMFKLRNPTDGSQEIPEARKCVRTVAFKGQYLLAFAPICKPNKNKLFRKLRAVKQNFLLKKKNIYPLN